MLRIKKLSHSILEFYNSLNIESYNSEIKFIEYSVGSNMDLGYYSPSKSDLFAKGIKRGRVTKKHNRHFTGFAHYFDANNRLIKTEYLISNTIYRVCFFVYDDTCQYGYDFDCIYDSKGKSSFIPSRVIECEYLGNLIMKCCNVSIMLNAKDLPKYSIKSVYSEEEKYEYIEGELSAIKFITAVFDYETNIMEVLSEEKFDHFNGRYWTKSC